MSRRSIRTQLTLMTLLSLASCAGLQRSFLAQMEHDDSTFYQPERDFRVVSGDSGRFWASDDERRARTPLSDDDIFEERSQQALRRELKDLEGAQTDRALELYSAHKSRLNISERIYLLKLPKRERLDYLASKGLLNEDSFTSQRNRAPASRDSEIALGMGKSEVMDSLGKPRRVEVAGNPSYENERWVYQVNGSTKYIYFESGEVQGWE